MIHSFYPCLTTVKIVSCPVQCSWSSRILWEYNLMFLFPICSFVIQVQCNIHWFTSGSLLTRENDSWDTSCGCHARTGRELKATGSYQSVYRRSERQWSRFEVRAFVISFMLIFSCITNVLPGLLLHGYAWCGNSVLSTRVKWWLEIENH